MKTAVAFALVFFLQAPPAIGAVQDEAAAPASPEATVYLQAAIELFRSQHINRANVDWQEVTAKAFTRARGAKTAAETYPAIRLIINELGEKHTSFIPAEKAQAQAKGKAVGNSQPPPIDLPEGELLAAGPAVIRLTAFMGNDDQGVQYANAARRLLTRFDQRGACGYIVDLRYNGGGNMWPMLNGLSGLFRDGSLGSFEDTQGKKTRWMRRNGYIAEEGVSGRRFGEPRFLKRPDLPVAVLIGPYTMSSGEFTAMAFAGRPRTRSFGKPSGGYVTVNNPVTLSDGAQIIMTVGWGSDRTGKAYKERLVPDLATQGGGPTLDAALTWLRNQGCGQPV